MITIDELKAKLGGMKTAVDDLRDALSIEASEKRLAELEHQMTMPGFYDDQARSQKIIGEMGEVKNKLERFGKLATQYEEAETLLEMIEEENDPALAAEGEEAVEGVEKSIDELQLMTMLNGEYDHNNAILTFHAGTGGTEAQDWAEMLYRMYTRWAEAHGYSVEVLDVLDGDEAGIKSASMMVKGANAVLAEQLIRINTDGRHTHTAAHHADGAALVGAGIAEHTAHIGDDARVFEESLGNEFSAQRVAGHQHGLGKIALFGAVMRGRHKSTLLYFRLFVGIVYHTFAVCGKIK